MPRVQLRERQLQAQPQDQPQDQPQLQSRDQDQGQDSQSQSLLHERIFNLTDDRLCAVCQDQDDLISRANYYITPSCGHLFHKRCINDWYSTRLQQIKKFCPVCKTEQNDLAIICTTGANNTRGNTGDQDLQVLQSLNRQIRGDQRDKVQLKIQTEMTQELIDRIRAGYTVDIPLKWEYRLNEGILITIDELNLFIREKLQEHITTIHQMFQN